MLLDVDALSLDERVANASCAAAGAVAVVETA